MKSILFASLIASVFAAPIDDYVWAADSHYKWEDTGYTIYGKNAKNVTFTGYLVNMTSQQWLTPEDCSRSIWWHQMVVIVPSNLDPNYKANATMYITGGSNPDCDPCTQDNWPKALDEDIDVIASLAMGTGTIGVSLFQVPNEHITFYSDPLLKSRTEDAIIAFTWRHFLDDPDHDPNWLVRFPMVKASVRAMDAVGEWLAAPETLARVPEVKGYTAEYFGVAGASKRGWTTWLVGAVDPERVTMIGPIVLDALNFVQFSHHQFKSYNGWTFALADYYDEEIMDRLDTPEMQLLAEQEDPFYFLDRLTMPKMVVNAVGDEFQMPDDTHFWWDSLPEPKHFLLVPNAEHSEATGIGMVVPAMGTFFKYVLDERAVPTMTWDIDNTTGFISLTLNTVPADLDTLHVRKYWTDTEKCAYGRRDFRFINLDDPCESHLVADDGTCVNDKVLWQWEDLEPIPGTDGKQYLATHPTPSDGKFAAFLIDVRYDKDPQTGEGSCDVWHLGLPEYIPRDFAGCLEFTTEASIIPLEYPYDDCVSIPDDDENATSPCHSSLL